MCPQELQSKKQEEPRLQQDRGQVEDTRSLDELLSFIGGEDEKQDPSKDKAAKKKKKKGVPDRGQAQRDTELSQGRQEHDQQLQETQQQLQDEEQEDAASREASLDRVSRWLSMCQTPGYWQLDCVTVIAFGIVCTNMNAIVCGCHAARNAGRKARQHIQERSEHIRCWRRRGQRCWAWATEGGRTCNRQWGGSSAALCFRACLLSANDRQQCSWWQRLRGTW